MIPLKQGPEDALPVGAIIGAAEVDLRRRERNMNQPAHYEAYAFLAADVRVAESVTKLIERTIRRLSGEGLKLKPPKKRSMQLFAFDLERLKAAAVEAERRASSGKVEAA